MIGETTYNIWQFQRAIQITVHILQYIQLNTGEIQQLNPMDLTKDTISGQSPLIYIALYVVTETESEVQLAGV